MPDSYPDYAALPAEWLVPPQDQPDYLALPGVQLDESLSLGAALSDALVARGLGAGVAIVHHESGVELTFSELAERSDRFADALVAAGVTPGSRVGVRVANRPEGIIAALAVWKIGAVMVPLPILARASELDFYLADTVPVALVTHGSVDDLAMVVDRAAAAGVGSVIAFGDELPDGVVSWAKAVAQAPPRPRVHHSLDSVAVVWHTGGTTGAPKGCYHTQRRFLLAGYSFGLGSGTGRGQRWAAAAPIGHALGLIYHTIFTLLQGATIVMVERFNDPRQLLEAISKHEVTTFTAITSSWAGMNEVLVQGGAPSPTTLQTGYAMWQSSSSSEVVAAWRARGLVLLNNFGSTAFATWILLPRPGTSVPQGALGHVAPGYQVRAVDPHTGGPVVDGDPGQMSVRGVSGLNYWRLPTKQRADVRGGWIYVDDLIQDLDDGVYGYLGRTDFLISTAGNKVAPGEVENVLARHPAVKEVAVIGLPDPLRMEAVAAFIVLNEGAHAGDDLRVELQTMVKTELSPYKYPRIVEFLPALPRDHVGKVQPKLIREQALRRMTR